MKTRSNKTLAKKGGKCGCSLSGGSYYKYNDLRNATPRDFLLSERDGAVGPLKGGRRRRTRRRTKRRSSKNSRRRGRRTRRGGSNIPRPSQGGAKCNRNYVNQSYKVYNRETGKKITKTGCVYDPDGYAKRMAALKNKNNRWGGNKTRRRTSRRRQKGGIGPNTIIPQDIVNIGRSAAHDMGSFANSYKGIAANASPLPTQDQLNNSYNFTYKPVSLSEIRAGAEAKVSQL